MRFAIAYSKKDPAGMNIIKQLKKQFLPQVLFLDTNQEIVYFNLSERKYPILKNVDFVVFASKHQSAKKENSLSLHAPGNFRNADFGGVQGKLCMTSAIAMKYLFQQLNKIASENKEISEKYNVTLEVTHHGPVADIPCCFIEIGSDEEQWNDENAGEIIAKTILSLQEFEPKIINGWIPTIGIGGPHYAPNFNKVQLNSEYAIGHIIPEYSLPLTESILKEAEAKTSEQIKEVLIDWKGCGSSEQRQEIINLLDKIGLKHKRTGNVEK